MHIWTLSRRHKGAGSRGGLGEWERDERGEKEELGPVLGMASWLPFQVQPVEVMLQLPPEPGVNPIYKRGTHLADMPCMDVTVGKHTAGTPSAHGTPIST